MNKTFTKFVRILLVFAMIFSMSQLRYVESVRAEEDFFVEETTQQTGTNDESTEAKTEEPTVEIVDETPVVVVTLTEDDEAKNDTQIEVVTEASENNDPQDVIPTVSDTESIENDTQDNLAEVVIESNEDENHSDDSAELNNVEKTENIDEINDERDIEVVKEEDIIQSTDKNDTNENNNESLEENADDNNEEIEDEKVKVEEPGRSPFALVSFNSLGPVKALSSSDNIGSAPNTVKTVVSNNDGTYKITLDIEGKIDQNTQITKANIIVVLDLSGSMNNDATGSTGTRLKAAKDAVKDIAGKLLGMNGSTDQKTGVKYPNDLVEMSLVVFGTHAEIKTFGGSQKTTNKDTFNNTITNLSVYSGNDGGTNWEDAFVKTNTVNFGDSDPTYVIFVSDGNPTFRNTKGNYNNLDQDYYKSESVYGNGKGDWDSTTVKRCLEHAKDDAKATVNKGYELYTLFAFGGTNDVKNLESLSSAAGAKAGNNYDCSDTTKLNAALSKIASAISEGLGQTGVSTTDGITALTTVTQNVNGTPTNVKYYTKGASDSTRKEWAGAPAAKFANGGVTWDLSSIGALEHQKHYIVEFDVWPSQAAYDLLADLNNGIKSYDSLDTNTKNQINKNADNTYSLKTNTNLTTSYAINNGQKATQAFDAGNYAMPLANMDLSIKKVFENGLDDRTGADKITLYVTKDGSTYKTVEITKDAEGNYIYSPIYIAPGIMKNGEILEPGHDYTVAEDASSSYHWELNADVYHPMLIDGQLTLLKESDNGTISLNGKKYSAVTSATTTLSATNYRRSNLNLTKVVTGDDADPDAFFKFTINVEDVEGKDIWFSVNDENGNTVKDLKTNATAEVKENANTGYYSVKSKTNFTVELKAGWNLRVTNLLSNSKYTITEEAKTPTDAWTMTGITSNSEMKSTRGNTITGNIDKPNTEYTVSYTNKYETVTTDSTVTKVWNDDSNADGNRPASITVTLYKNGEPTNTTATLNAGNNWSHTETGLEKYTGDEENKYSWKEAELTQTLKDMGYSLGSETTTDNNTTITNNYDKKFVNIKVTKVWDDNNNADGNRPSKITVTLYKNGEATTTTKELTGSDWSATLEDLPLYENGSKNEYTWVESLTSAMELRGYKYAKTEQNDAKTETTITNSYETDTIELTVTKIWDDASNQDGKRPTSVKFTVTGSDKSVYTATLTGNGDTWSTTIPNVRKLFNGEVVTFTVAEEDLSSVGYKVTNIDQATRTITNSYTPETTELSVVKEWNDANNQDGKRPTELTVSLMNGNTVVETVKLNDKNEWKATVENLAVYENGSKITYTWTEDTTGLPEGYSLTNTVTSESGTTTLTNSYTPGKVSATVVKSWNDNSNQDGKRPTSLTVKLMNGETEVETVILSDRNKWTETVSDLPEYTDGVKNVYTWTEPVVAGYTSESSVEGTVTTFTNTHEIEKTTSTVIKVWEDSNNVDGNRPASITVTLNKNGEATNTTKTLNAENGWTYTEEGLVKYENGTPVSYSWTETVTEEMSNIGYSQKDDPVTNNNTTTIINTYTTLTEDLTVTKVWEDNSNQDGLRPETVKFTVTGSDGKTYDATLKGADNTWTAEIENVRKYYNGEEVTFTVTEEDVANYTVKSTDNKTLTITNTHTPATQDLTVVKVWDDANNQDGKRPTVLRVDLMNGETAVDTVVLKEENNWTATVKDLPVKASGKDIVYTWVEDLSTEGYSLTNTVLSQDGKTTTLTNSYAPGKVSATVVKSWNDNSNQDGKRPETLTVTLMNGDSKVKDVTLTAENNWTVTVTDLPEYTNAVKNVYKFVENDVPAGYTMTASTSGSTTTITNKHEIEKTSSTVTKVWEDNDDADGNRPTSLTVTLMNGDSKVKDVTLTSDNNWTATVEDLDKYTGGELNSYSWIESVTDEMEELGYSQKGGSPVTENNNTTITNTYETVIETLTVTKVWEDNSNQDGLRPETVKFTVTGSDGKTYDATLKGADNTWTAEIENVRKYYNGEEVTFTVTEEDVANYTVKSTDNETLTITNTHEIEKTTSTVVKNWVDNDDQDGVRPATLTVTLTANGENTEITKVLSKDNNWTATATDLDKYANGNEIEYSWTEGEIDGYTWDETSVLDNGSIQLTNKHEIEKTDLTVVKVWDDKNNQDGVRPVSLRVNLMDGETIVDTVELNARNNWTATVKDLDVNKNGNEINYTWSEQLPEGTAYVQTKYETSEDGKTVTITNSYETETTTKSVNKVWDDNNNQDGKRPTSLTVKLMNGETVVATKVLDETNKWSATVEGLDKYANGQLIEYTWVEELTTDEYKQVGEPKVEGNVTTITNKHEIEKTSSTVTKVWEDNDDADGNRPAELTVSLYKGETLIKEVTLTAEEEWTYTEEGLDKYEAGKELEYSWTEKVTEEMTELGYSQKEGSPVTENNNTTITNTYETVTETLTVTKVWNDNSNQDGKRPETVKFTVTGSDEATYEVEFDGEDDTWTAEIENVRKYYNGTEVTFTVAEDEIEQYEIEEVDDETLTITNKHDIIKTEVEFEKVWVGDEESYRPESITVVLVANGEETENVIVATAEDNYAGKFEDLDMYENGEEIVYTLKEVEVENYISQISGDAIDGFTITNTYNLRNVEVIKLWIEKFVTKYRPDSITVNLLADGAIVDTAELTEEGEWFHVFEDLTIYNVEETGELVEIEYTVEEIEVENYKTEIEGDMANGFIITNTADGHIDVPPTGDQEFIYASAISGTSLALMIVAIVLKKKYEDEIAE